MFNIVEKEFEVGSHKIKLQTGKVARQADGAVILTSGKTTILATVVISKTSKEGQDFFPLSVHYQEKFYSNGKIPGGFLRREGRPSEKETLISRLIDRPIRPMFASGFMNEVQVIISVLSLDEETNLEMLSILAGSAAISISGAPFSGPIGSSIVGYKNDQFILNPTAKESEESLLELSVAGTKQAVLMVESSAKELSDKLMLEAIAFGHKSMKVAIEAITEFQVEVAKPVIEWSAKIVNEDFKKTIESDFLGEIKKAYEVSAKQERYKILNSIKENIFSKYSEDLENGSITGKELEGYYVSMQKQVVRGNVLEKEQRIDGRGVKGIRPIEIEVGLLPQAHGSALFTRGETQALVVTTLGSDLDTKLVEELTQTYKDNFMLHYNFPPFSVGECGRLGTPGRREIGHGMLARRSVAAVLPADEFDYTIRVVSEITESNGSSSMATVCGGSLSMMDAGVPLKGAVSGIAMGLIKEGDNFKVISDILGDEDHLGDMDFKVAGTSKGVTALQMDIKIDGITLEIMEIALEQAKEGRLHILKKMNSVLADSRLDVADNAPRIYKIKIDKSKIGSIIGKGGETIRDLSEKSKTKIDIDNEGVIKIAATTKEGLKIAQNMIDSLTLDAEVGSIYEAKIKKIMAFGAFAEFMPSREGLIHVSEIADERVEDVNSYLEEGEIVRVKLLDIDRNGKYKLSIKAVEA